MWKQQLLNSLILTTSATALIIQPSQAQITQVTDVEVNETSIGIEVLIETLGVWN